MLPFLCIDDVNSLKNILCSLKLSKSDNGLQYLFSYFPFKAMIENRPETICLLLEILEYFLDNTKFLQNVNNSLSYTIEFTLTNISYFAKRRDARMLYKLIKFLGELFSRTKFMLSAISVEIDVDRICELIIHLAEDPTLNFHLALLLTEILAMREIIFTEHRTVDFCISKLFYYLEPDSLELSILATATLRALPRLTLESGNLLYQWLYNKCPKLLDKVTYKVKINILDSIVLAYETRDRNKDGLKLTNIYIRKISSFCRLLRHKDFIGSIMKIFCYIINDFVSMGMLPFMENDFLQNMNFVIRAKDNPILSSEVMLIISYLQCLESPDEINKDEVIAAIRIRCLAGTYYPAIILKALCLLYPVCVGNQKWENGRVLVESNILDAVERYKHLSQIITYNLAQLQWFLKSNRLHLKRTALEMCLVNYKDDKIILSAVKATDNTDLLVRCLLIKSNEDIPKRAGRLLSQLQCPRISILIKKQLPASCQSESCLTHLLKANPAVPITKNEGLLFCTMMSRILPVLTERDAIINACRYSIKLLMKFKTFAKAAQEFILNENCIVQMYEAASNDNDDIAISAIILLVILIKLQHRHCIKVYHSTVIDFRRLLKGSSRRLIKSMSLLNLFLELPEYKPVISIRKSDTIDLYQHLQQLQCIEVYPRIIKTLMQLHKIYPFLIYLSGNMIYVEAHCLKTFETADHIEHFILFLINWLENISNERINLYNISHSIRLFLKAQPYTNQVRLLMKLLKKCSG